MKKKKILIIISIILIALIAIVAAVIVKMCTKTGWNESGMFGQLELMDDSSGIKSDSLPWKIEDYMDFKFEGQLVIMEGTVNLKYCIGDEIILEETYGPGTYEPKTDIYSGYDDELNVIIEASDDIQGSYDISIFYRYRRFHNYLNETMGVSQ